MPPLPLGAFLQADIVRQAGCAVRDGKLRQVISIAHVRLGITPDQDADWTRMAGDIAIAAEPLIPECDRPTDPPAKDWADTLEQMRHQAMLLAVLARGQAAAAAMWQKLSPAQQEIVSRTLLQVAAGMPLP